MIPMLSRQGNDSKSHLNYPDRSGVKTETLLKEVKNHIYLWEEGLISEDEAINKVADDILHYLGIRHTHSQKGG